MTTIETLKELQREVKKAFFHYDIATDVDNGLVRVSKDNFNYLTFVDNAHTTVCIIHGIPKKSSKHFNRYAQLLKDITVNVEFSQSIKFFNMVEDNNFRVLPAIY